MMPTRFKDINGFWITDDRKTVQEWAKEIGGRFGILCFLEMRAGAEPEDTTLWAAIRTDGAWDPQWFQVPDEVTFRIPDLAEYAKPEAGSEKPILGGDVKKGRAAKTKSKFRTDRREYV